MTWKTSTLDDGSIIKVKTMLKEVRRIKEHGDDGKPVHSIEAGNEVEVVKVPRFGER